jgi:hypothetical protein
MLQVVYSGRWKPSSTNATPMIIRKLLATNKSRNTQAHMCLATVKGQNIIWSLTFSNQNLRQWYMNIPVTSQTINVSNSICRTFCLTGLLSCAERVRMQERHAHRHVNIRATRFILNNFITPWPLVRKRTIPTERPPLVGEVSANFCE